MRVFAEFSNFDIVSSTANHTLPAIILSIPGLTPLLPISLDLGAMVASAALARTTARLSRRFELLRDAFSAQTGWQFQCFPFPAIERTPGEIGDPCRSVLFVLFSLKKKKAPWTATTTKVRFPSVLKIRSFLRRTTACKRVLRDMVSRLGTLKIEHDHVTCER